MTNYRPSHRQIQRTLFFTMLWLTGIYNVAQIGNAQTTSLQGKVVYLGPLPSMEEVIIKKDIEVCGKTRELQSVVLAEDKGLQDVIVSVKMEGKDRSIEEPEPTKTIVNKGCQFLKHAITATVKQKLAIENLDNILHNTHVRTKTRAFINVVLLPQAKGVQKVLREPGLMTVTCNKHPFMNGVIHVFTHPYHTVTDSYGHFTIPSLPSGTYTLTFWHETLGTIQQPVTIPPKNNAILNIEFPARVKPW